MRTFGTAELIAGDSLWDIKADPHVIMRVKRIFTKSDLGRAGTISLSYTQENCHDLEWLMVRYPLVLSDRDAEMLRQGAQGHQDRVLRLEEFFRPDYVPRAFEMVLPPRSYQAQAAEICLEQGYLLVADEVGLGKTCTSICMMTEPKALPVTVVCMTHLPDQWKGEIKKFLPDLTTHIIKYKSPYPLPEFLGRGPDVVIINYHKISTWAKILGEYCNTVIFDEVQELRRSESQKYRAARELTELVIYRMGLSATPIYNYGGEIYNVLNMLNREVLGSRAEFNREWCEQYGYNSKRSIKDPRAFGSWARENFILVRNTRRQVGRELPEVTRITQDIGYIDEMMESVEESATDLTRIILQEYEDAKGDKWRASERLSNVLRQATGIAKAPMVADFVKMLVETGEKVVLYGWHRGVYDIWERNLTRWGIKVAYYTGTENPKKKAASKESFICGDTDVLFMSLRSGAGLDGLQDVCSVAVFGELDWSPGVHEQCIGRIHRDGQDDPVVAYFLVADDGSDPTVAEVLGLKREQVEGIRDPEHQLVEKLDTSAARERIKRLAQDYAERHGIEVQTEEVSA